MVTPLRWIGQSASRCGIGRMRGQSLPDVTMTGTVRRPLELAEPVLEATRVHPRFPQRGDGFGDEKAQWDPDGGDEVEGGIELVEAGLEMFEREWHRPGDVACRVLLSGSNVEDDNGGGAGTLEQVVARDPLGAVGAGTERPEDLLHFGKLP